MLCEQTHPFFRQVADFFQHRRRVNNHVAEGEPRALARFGPVLDCRDTRAGPQLQIRLVLPNERNPKQLESTC